MNYVILDWAGNLMFNGEKFKTFDDAWDYIFAHFDQDEMEETPGEYQVISTSEYNGI